jgi:glycosyltransferase involved in cell wall biosynthesis
VYSGGLGKRKNVGLLLKAFKILESAGENVELIISGAHPDRTVYPSLAGEMGLKNIHFTGYIDDRCMADFYRSGHLMVFPSEYEGFGLAPLESMASGTPVLSAKGGALQETSGDGAMYFEYDAADLAAKILKLKEDEALRNELTLKGLKRASTFTWEKTVAQTEALYRMIT